MTTHEDDPLRTLVESGLTYAEAEAAHDLAKQSPDYRTVLREMALRGDMRLTANQRRHLSAPDAPTEPRRKPSTSTGGDMTTITEYAVLCPRDGEVRDISTPDDVQAVEWAASRDANCGRCYVGQGKHVVVSRTVTPWTPDA